MPAQAAELFSFKNSFPPFEERLNPFFDIVTGHHWLQVREQALLGHFLPLTHRDF